MKQVNFFNRRRNTSYKPAVPEVVADSRFTVTSVFDEDTKRMVKKSEYRTINRHAEMKEYRCSDFALENLLSVNAQLIPCQLIGDRFANIRNIEASLSSIENNMSNQTNNNE